MSDNHLLFFSHVYDLNLTDSLISNVTGTNAGVGDLRALMLDSILPKEDKADINTIRIVDLKYENNQLTFFDIQGNQKDSSHS